MKSETEKLKPGGPPGDFQAELADAIADFGLEALSEPKLALLAAHFKLLSDWNLRSNLTRITSPKDAARLHYAESIFGAQFIARSASVLDVGSGAGFPAVPIAVIRPDLQVTALEPNLKKSVFLKEVIDALALENLRVVRARPEDIDWSGFHAVTTRAVEHAGEVVPRIVRQLHPNQNLVLFCTRGLTDNLSGEFQGGIDLSVHRIPGANERLVAIVRRI